eukprot:COSAG02_NODE_65626_length_257_cov_1.177215_1_plen_66_part_10
MPFHPERFHSILTGLGTYGSTMATTSGDAEPEHVGGEIGSSNPTVVSWERSKEPLAAFRGVVRAKG